MTGVAAKMCGDRSAVISLGYQVKADGKIFDESGNHVSQLGERRVMLTDIAGFCAGEARAGWKADDNERRACIAIALALLL